MSKNPSPRNSTNLISAFSRSSFHFSSELALRTTVLPSGNSTVWVCWYPVVTTIHASEEAGKKKKNPNRQTKTAAAAAMRYHVFFFGVVAFEKVAAGCDVHARSCFVPTG